jgi:ribosomal protein S18 acetylase RimI-like enzyme
MKVSRYRIETMKLSDFAAVCRLWRKSEGIGLNESDTRANIAIFLKRNPAMSFVARQSRIIVGAVLCGHDGRRGYLHHLAVAKNHRGNGVGKRLVEASFSALSRAGITRCNIYLINSNTAGEAFWKHNGWNKLDGLQVLQKAVGKHAQPSCGC